MNKSEPHVTERAMRNDWLVFFCQSFFVLALFSQIGILLYFAMIGR